MEHWPALARWRDPAYLLAAAGPRTVPVELGAHYLAPGWGQQLMPFSDFVAAHLLGGRPDSGAGGGGGGGGSVARRGYLAQHELFAQVRQLSEPCWPGEAGQGLPDQFWPLFWTWHGMLSRLLPAVR